MDSHKDMSKQIFDALLIFEFVEKVLTKEIFNLNIF